ncbi:MAG: dipeptidase [Rhodobacter sp.]|nr:dipeptidase [Rhodobacter sp.]
MDVGSQQLFFDGHNDVLLKLSSAGGVAAAEAFLSGCDGHIDSRRAATGGFGGGFFAIYVPTPGDKAVRMDEMVKPRYDVPLPDPVPQPDALVEAMRQAAILVRLEELGALKICRTAAEIRACMTQGTMAAIMHIEGAEAIDAEFNALEIFHRAGLRSIGPVWSRETIYGHGVPFRYPGSPDTGPGLTDHGKRLIERCNTLGIMIDLSHLNQAGFWDVAGLSTAPLVATHSNAHAICPHSRNLTDDQLRAIADSDGMVGLNFAVAFLREDGRMIDDVPLSEMLRHLDHLMSILGEDRVGMGSDFDGAVIPKELDSVAGLPKLRDAMVKHGYGDTLIAKLCHGNWLRVLEKTWGH